MWACSAFTTHACLRDAHLLEWLDSDEARLRVDADRAAFVGWVTEAMATCAPGNDSEFMKALRIFRRRHLVRIAWRDLAKLAPIDTVLRELSWLAEACIGAACRFATATLQQRHGLPEKARRQRVVAAGPRHGQARGRRTQLFIRHRPGVPVSGTRRNHRAASTGTRGILRARGQARGATARIGDR